jgi:hypothetical protein
MTGVWFVTGASNISTRLYRKPSVCPVDVGLPPGRAAVQLTALITPSGFGNTRYRYAIHRKVILPAVLCGLVIQNCESTEHNLYNRRMMEICRTQPYWNILCMLYSFIQATCFDPLNGSSSGHRSIYKSYGLRLPAGIPFSIVYIEAYAKLECMKLGI